MSAPLVTTTLPGDHGVTRCEHCGDPLLVSADRLPRLRSGEDERWCDDCIGPALHACAARSRRGAPTFSRPVPRPDTTTPRRAAR